MKKIVNVLVCFYIFLIRCLVYGWGAQEKSSSPLENGNQDGFMAESEFSWRAHMLRRKVYCPFKKKRKRKLRENTLKKNPKDVNYGSLTFNLEL